VTGAAPSRELVEATAGAAVAERDQIQANVLDLDRSFGKRLLEGATLAGETRKRWDEAAAGLTGLWQRFNAYSAVVDAAAERLARARRSGPELAEIMALLNGPSVRLAGASSALAQRDLTGTGDIALTPAAAVQQMRRAFATAAGVVTAAETVWNQASDILQHASADLAEARRRADGLADEALTGALGAAEAEFVELRDVLNSDPLAFWQRGQVDVVRLDRLQDRAAAALSRAGELARQRDEADQRIAAVAAVVAAAREARQDAAAACDRAATRIAASALPLMPQVTLLTERLADLEELKAAGRWARLATELDAIEKRAVAAAKRCREAEQEALALLDRRDELRGLLDGYQARAMRLGAAEDGELQERYDRARDLLWTAPCDLLAAGSAVTEYQQAVLALAGKGREP
jgi:chromosome segregation ATPase